MASAELDLASAADLCRNLSGGLISFQSETERDGINFWFQRQVQKFGVSYSRNATYTAIKFGDIYTYEFGFQPVWCSGSAPDNATDPEMPILLSTANRSHELCWIAANYTVANYICEKRGG